MRTNLNEYNISFEKRIKLSQKSQFNFPKKSGLIHSTTPIDFFFNDNRVEKALSNFKTHLNLKRSKTESPFMRSLLHCVYQVNNFFRTLSSAGYLLFNFKNYQNTLKTFGTIKPESSAYIDEWAKLGNSCHNKTININLEDRVLENIVKKGKNYIFLLNHSDFIKDKYIYIILNSFLNYGYSNHNMQKECPRPLIIVSDNMFKIAGNSLKNLYRNLGLLPINTKTTKEATLNNISTMKGLTDNFSNGNVNLFLFPEGINSIFKEKALKDKFQLKSIKLLENLLNKTKEIQIIPVGISYNNTTKNNIGNINLGFPITLKKKENLVKIIANDRLSEIGKIGKTTTRKELTNILSDILQQNIEKSKHLDM